MTCKGVAAKFYESKVALETDECIIWEYSKVKGYGQICIEKKMCSVHRIALILHKGNPPNGRNIALHSCHNPACFNYRHLRWGTTKENMADKIIDGTHQSGERNPRAKLTKEQVNDIRESTLPQRKLANIYGVTQTNIQYIKSNKIWKLHE
jgi:hypothetical protein